MQRRAPSKRILALAAAGLIIGAAGALSVPALAEDSAAPRAASVQALTLDFGATPPEADVHSLTGRVKDTTGAVIGSAHHLCVKDQADPRRSTAFCHGSVRITAGRDGNNGEIAYSAVLPITDDAPVPDGGGFTGTVEGGTLAYEGITGEARFQRRGPGVYDLGLGLR
ncbi:hypothetical protein ACWEQL_19240 [Kitasatospora sp. NPDC004240]